MKRTKWEMDLRDGNLGERIVVNYLCEKYNWSVLSFNNTGSHDAIVKTGKGNIKLEIKTDRWEKFNRITNNMIIETFCRGKLSGISKTEADYFIYFYPEWEIIYLISVKKLKEIMIERKDLFRYQTGIGDDGAVNAYICNRFLVEEYFKTYKIAKSPEWDKK